MTKEEQEALYKKNDVQLDLLKDNNSKFILFGQNKDRRILVDIEEPKLPSIRCRIKKGYIELSVRLRKGGSEVEKSLGRYMTGIIQKEVFVDHINRNVLDNRRVNLRIVNKHVSAINKNRRPSAFRYKCVYKKKDRNSWILKVSKDCMVYKLVLPIVYTEEECAKIYDCLSLKINGDYNQTNFDSSNYSPQQIDEVHNDFIGFVKISKRPSSK